MMIKSLPRRLFAPLLAVLLAVSAALANVHAAERVPRVAVLSFGLFGGQGVFRKEATGAAQIVARRFGADPVIVRFNSKNGGDATVWDLATSLHAVAEKIDRQRDILFLILT